MGVERDELLTKDEDSLAWPPGSWTPPTLLRLPPLSQALQAEVAIILFCLNLHHL